MYLKTKILFLFLLVGLSLNGQSFTYSYIDPCTQQLKTIFADMSSPIVIAYYGEVKSFTYDELQNGVFDNWINNIYLKYQSTSPCQGVLVSTTTTTTTNQVSNVLGNVMNLVNLDFSSVSNVGAGVGMNVGSTTQSGTNVSTSQSKENKDGGNSTDNSTDRNGNSSGGQGNEPGTGSSGSSQGQEGQGNVGGNGGSSNNNSSSNSSSSNNGGSGNGNGGSTDGNSKSDQPTEQQVEQQKTESQKTQSNSTTKAASKAKTETQKPAILLTGDIVGIQTKSDGAQDARATMSFTRVKGDGTASIGLSADYMVGARIGNVSAIKSWIGVNKSGHKHINVLSGGLGLMPSATTGNVLFVRVNSIKRFTALYGGAGTYGSLYGEELISTVAIAGFMYKGNVTKSLEATIIMAGIYSPYTKYYTESLFESKPLVIPFLNLNYKLTKTFGVGLTAGGTYITGQDILNFQILMGAKMKL